MTKKRTLQTDRKAKRSRIKRLLVTGAGICAVAAAITVIWAVPAFIRMQVRDGIRQFFGGNIQIESIEVGRGGLVYVRTVNVQDQDNRQSVQMRLMRLSFDKWPSLTPVVTHVEIEGFKMQVFAEEGRLIIPLLSLLDRPEPVENKYVDIREVEITDLSVNVNSIGYRPVIYDGLSLSSEKQQQQHNIRLKRKTADTSESFETEGTIDFHAQQTALSVQMKHTVTKDEMTSIASGLNITVPPAQGKLEANLTFKGSFKDISKSQLQGMVKLRNWTVAAKDAQNKLVTHIFDTDVNLNGSLIRLDNTTVRQADGSEWFIARSSNLTLRDWPGPQPVLTELSIDGLKLQSRLTDRKLELPFKSPQAKDDQSAHSRVDLQKLSVNDACLAVQIDDSELTFDNLSAQVVSREDTYEFSLHRLVPQDPNTFLIQGAVNPRTFDAKLSIQGKYNITKNKAALLLKRFKTPIASAQCTLEADLTVAGPVRKPAQLQYDGTVNLHGTTITTENGKDKQTVSIGKAEIPLADSQVNLHRLSIRNADGLQWLMADSVTLTLRDRPGPQAVLTAVEADGLRLESRIVGRRLVMPCRVPETTPREEEKRRIDLEHLTVRNGSVTIADRNNHRLTIDNLTLRAAAEERSYRVNLSRTATTNGGTLLIEGTVNPATSDMQLSVKADHTVSKPHTVAALEMLKVAGLSAAGRFQADLTITGRPGEPETLHPQGTVTLNNWLIAIGNNIIARDLTATVRLGRKRFDFENVSAGAFNGRIEGSFYGGPGKELPLEIGGHILAREVNLAEMTKKTAARKIAKKGMAALDYKFTMDDRGIDSLRGEGLVFLNDADLSILPVVPQIFRALGLVRFDPTTMSDAEAAFTMAWPTMTIKHAHIANKLAAIEAEPGGKVNLQKHHVDMHIVAVPFRQLDALMKQIPVVDIFAHLKDKLTRLRIKGNWSDPPNKLITKQPMKDIKDGTAGFLRDVVSSGGQISQGMLKTLGILFYTQKKKNSAGDKTDAGQTNTQRTTPR